MANLTYFLIAGIIILLLVVYILIKWLIRIRRDFSVLKNSKISQSVKYGKIAEQFIPFIDYYPYDSSGFRFIGTPIDGIQFEEDRVVLVEFKTANSKLSQKQKMIKKLVEDKKVEFKEFNLNDKT